MNDRNPAPARRKRWWRVLFWLLILLLAAFVFRVQLERVVIAMSMRNEHIFHEPAELATESWWTRNREVAGFYWDVSKLRVARQARLREFNPELRPLVKEITCRQAAHQG